MKIDHIDNNGRFVVKVSSDELDPDLVADLCTLVPS